MTGEKKKNFSFQALLKSINSEESPDFSKDQHILKRQPGFFFFRPMDEFSMRYYFTLYYFLY